MFRMFFAAYLAIPFLAAVSFDGSSATTASSLSCPCGQCDDGCGCCAGGMCTCDDCACEACGCNGATSLASFTSEGKKPSCCSAGASCAGDASAFLALTQGECDCAACPVGCESCEDCTEGECVCPDCADAK